ncbi:HRDC domain-containing protein [Gulosibacter faecalis]|uniref:HRDC domain-containing protein n=1 Tax=Gulosibacter faecalis TaxID=272240 RepID=A0ABW5UZ25_9MICO|nr:ribonuclease D [Gulosibacter faecalis]
MATVDDKRLERGGLEVIDTHLALSEALDRLEAGTGPVAIDTERASGYRFSDQAYLIQIFRRGTGTLLIDPIPFGSLASVTEVIADDEWILHAATQDLPCMRDIALEPTRLFDTELAARLLGMERVGLGAVVQELLGIELAKAHSADDWSVRPLPKEWLAYAALDVELLVDVRDALAERLREAGKDEWARQEFADIQVRELNPVKHVEPEANRDPERWRSLNGVHQLRSPRALAIARELWFARDALARETDTAPGRIVPDRALIAAAKAAPRSRGQLAGLKEFTGRQSRSQLDRWWEAVAAGLATDTPPGRRPAEPDRIPPLKAWEQKRPEAHARIQAARPAVADRAEELHVPTENLLTPALLRRVAWDSQANTPDEVRATLAELGARQWQIDITAPVIASAFVEAAQPGSVPPSTAS